MNTPPPRMIRLPMLALLCIAVMMPGCESTPKQDKNNRPTFAPPARTNPTPPAPPKPLRTQAPIQVPEFYVEQALRSADPATREQLIEDSVQRFVAAMDQQQVYYKTKAYHLVEGYFDIHYISKKSGKFLEKKPINLARFRLAEAAEVSQSSESYISLTFKPASGVGSGFSVMFSATGKAVGLDGAVAKGGLKDALSFIEACEVLGVRVDR